MNAPLVVRARPPLQQRVALIAALAMAAVMIWGVFEWGRKAGGHDAIEAAKARRALGEKVIDLEKANEALRLGDLAEYQRLIDEAERLIQRALEQVEPVTEDATDASRMVLPG